MSDDAQEVANILRGQLKEILEIMAEGKKTGAFRLAIDRMRRWRRRTGVLIQEHISKEEAGPFLSAESGYNRIEHVELQSKGERYASRLAALIEEIDQHGIRFLRGTNEKPDPPEPANVAPGQQEVRMPDPTNQGDPRRVFVVHGRNSAARKAMFEFLRALDLRPMEWPEAIQFTGKGSPYIGEILDGGFRQCRAAVVLFTGDDEVRLRPELWSDHEQDSEKQGTYQPRPNVLYEAGYAFALYPDRTILVELGSMRPILSDLGGKHTVRLRDSAASRQELRTRLVTVGCTVNDSGTDWTSAGDFKDAILPNRPHSDQEDRPYFA